MNGKGDRNRTDDLCAYAENHDRIDWDPDDRPYVTAPGTSEID